MEESMVPKENFGKKRKRILIAVGCVTAVVVLVYLALCIYVGVSGTVLSGVRVDGLKLGGLTREQAVLAVEDWAGERYSQVTYTLQCGASRATVMGTYLSVDGEDVAHRAYMVGRSENFFKRGAVILAHLFGKESQVPWQPKLEGEGAEAFAQAVEQLAEKESTALVETIWSVENYVLTVTRGTTGRTLDGEQARQKLLLEAVLLPGDQVIEVPVINVLPEEPDFHEIHSRIYAQAQDSFVDPENYRAVPHVVGVDFDTTQAEERFRALGEGESMRVELTVTMPELTQAKLHSMLFRDLLGECTTNIGGTENRLNNVIVAAKAIDGIVLMPGDVFSYNDALGPRTAERGYLPAPAYIGGKTVDDIGGGICQDSSTLYLAVLRANLEIVERTNHMYTVGYVPDGLDATVAYNAIDFKFRNDTDYPLCIEAEVSGRKITIRLRGTKVKPFSVKMMTETLSTNPYEVIYKPDDTVAIGKTVVDTTAYTGRKVRVYRCVYNADGALVSKELESTDNYRRRDKVILYNPADAARLGLVDQDGKVHQTILPVAPAPEPEPQPVPDPAPAPEIPPEAHPETAHPETVEPEQSEGEQGAVEHEPLPPRENPGQVGVDGNPRSDPYLDPDPDGNTESEGAAA